MKVKNNYNECLTNLACSIRKYFDLEYHHNTLSYIDDILEKEKPTNVVLMLLDGMGSNIIDRALDKDSFFIKNRYKKITTVFPATTTAATTSIRTGLNPAEHGMLGWNTYLYPIDKTITLFMGREKGSDEICTEFNSVKDKLLTKSISEQLNEVGKYKSIELFPFPTSHAVVYKDLDEMMEMILNETKSKDKKFIYAYNDEPDHTMHEYGPDSKEARDLIIERNNKVEDLASKLEDTLLIVIADHGHIKTDNIYLEDYKELYNMLERTTSLEQRAVSFKIKDEYIDKFEDAFNKEFGNYFSLYTKQEIVDSKLFGDGVENELFDKALGDFIAVADNSNKALLTKDDENLYSNHAGYTDDEIYVPLILKLKK